MSTNTRQEVFFEVRKIVIIIHLRGATCKARQQNPFTCAGINSVLSFLFVSLFQILVVFVLAIYNAKLLWCMLHAHNIHTHSLHFF